MALKPLEVIQEQDNGNFSFEELPFFEGILKNEYILVVGSGIILDRAKFPHNNGDLYTYIVDSINYIYKTDFSNLSEIVQHPIRNMPNAPIHDLLINKLEYDIEDITPELRTILNQRHFRFVFSTTPDHYLETLLTGIWGNDLRIVNFSDHNSLERFSDILKDTAINKYSQPTLFYVFGKAVKGQSNPVKFLQTDNDAIAYIEKWMKLENDNPIVEFLKAKRILGIGCNFDDWYYRFFWHILTRDFISRNSVAPYKTDNAVLEEDSSPLGGYLNNMNVCIHTEPWSVLKYIGHMFSKQLGDNTLQTLINQHKLEGKVFISYKTTPDKRAAAILVDELTRQNSFKIWFDDSNLLGGQPYNKKIPEARRFSKVFIPVLTETVAKT